jgi:hypothetical protein
VSDPQHTATPWDTKPTAGGHQHIIWDESGKTIAVVYTDVKDADFIVSAANAHDEFKRTLAALIDEVERAGLDALHPVSVQAQNAKALLT